MMSRLPTALSPPCPAVRLFRRSPLPQEPVADAQSDGDTAVIDRDS